MHIRLTELGLNRRLSWQEVADIQADHEADVVAAIGQAIEDQARFSVDAAQARHVEIVYQLLTSAPYRRGAYYEPRGFATFERKPAPDFGRPGEVVDVDPDAVPDLPGLLAVPRIAARLVA